MTEEQIIKEMKALQGKDWQKFHGLVRNGKSPAEALAEVKGSAPASKEQLQAFQDFLVEQLGNLRKG